MKLFPDFFQAYNWVNANHASRGFPGDTCPGFPWIKSLEERGSWLAKQTVLATAPTDFVREILTWGAGKNDPSMRFETGLGNVSLLALMQEVILNLSDPTKAIAAALQIPGCGLTYASKLLRFLNPSQHASLDNRIRDALCKTGRLDKITDSSGPSMVRGYVKFQAICVGLVDELESSGIVRPACSLPKAPTVTGWRVADVEMAMFEWADRLLTAARQGQLAVSQP
ncbi:hypothetical protein NPS42_03740 [Pseudomonas putida]|uniref:hypothetical protein n=1 Tax=Pseudomonas putida TaxID=303 RepID=UPI002363A0C5|nr:hypothetical protein [Pseudomonas putida]MDD2024921.1 hypothetical protein [Pseudomonas putida]HDS1765342.1 hypothetical protein [Pseudomonas putida]